MESAPAALSSSAPSPPLPAPAQPLRLGTRASPLALAQADLVRAALLATHGWPGDCVTLVPMVASGDRVQDRALADIGGKALWTRELDVALRDGRIDAAVHSMKDVETIRPASFALAAILPRADVRDRLIGAAAIAELPPGARVGTASPRRSAQLKRLRPDIQLTLFRGNVATRLGRIERGEADATLLAAAGLDRLGLGDTGVAISIEELLPAPQQGAIGVEVRGADAATRAAIAGINHADSCNCIMAERTLLEMLGGDCQSPVAALATIGHGGAMTMTVQLFSTDGADAVSGTRTITDDDAIAALVRELLVKAPDSIRQLFAAPPSGEPA